MSIKRLFAALGALCLCGVASAYAGDLIPDPVWRTYEHRVGLENNGVTPFIVLSRDGKKVELRPSPTVARCGAGTWEQLMNMLATDQNRIVRMRTARCGDEIEVFLDTDEKRDVAAPATDGTGFIGTLSSN